MSESFFLLLGDRTLIVNFDSKLIFDELSEGLIVRVHSELVPSTLENS